MNLYGNFLKRTLCAMLACTVFLGCFASPLRAEQFGAEDYYDLILEVKHNRKTLSKAIVGLEKDGKYFLPLLELAQLFDFAANYDAANASVSGFFLSDENTYGLNIKGRSYSLKGESYSFLEGEAFVFDQGYGLTEVYMSPELLRKIWPMSIDFNNLLQVITVETDKKLPYQSKAERERKRSKKLNRLNYKNSLKESESDASLVLKNAPKLFSLPALNVNSVVQWNQDNGSHKENISLNGRNDLLYGEVDYNLRVQNDTDGDKGIQDVRFKYTKRAYDDDDLPLGVKLLQVGDVSSKTARLTQGSIQGRGVVFTNASHKKKVTFDSLTVEGTTEPGWEVELYKNNQLQAYQIASDTGEYRFEDVQLNYSKTTIKVILYGPQGQVEEREEVYNISRDMLRPGETVYEVGIVDADRDFILLGDEDVERESGFANNITIDRGINSNLSAFGTFTDLPTDVGQQRFATLGLKFSLLDTIGAVEAYRGLDGGSALDFNFSRKFFDTNFSFRSALLNDFESNIVGYGDKADVLKIKTNANRSFKLPVGNMGLQLGLNYERRKDKTSLTTLTSGQNLSMKKFRFSNNTTSTFNEHRHVNTNGKFNFFYNHNLDWSFRGVVDYGVYPYWDVDNLRAELRYKNADGLTAALDTDYNIRSKNTRLGTQLGYDFKKFKSSVDLDWHSENGVRAMLRTRFSMAPYGVGSKYLYDSKSLVNRSGVAGRVFYDNDYDGVYSEGDELAPDAKMKFGRTKSKVSGVDGIAQYTAQKKLDYTDVAIDLSAVGDPYVVSGQDEFKTILRPGTGLQLDFPIIRTGIIEGIVYGAEGPIRSLPIQLLDANKEVVETTRTAFDGYYGFEFIRPGDYTVQVDPEISQINIPPRSVLVTSEELFQFGIDLQTLEQAAEAACNEAIADGRITPHCQGIASSTGGIVQPALVSNSKGTSGVQAGQSGEGTSGVQTNPTNKGTSGVRVKHVRIGEYSDKIRIVLDLSAPTAIRVWENADRKKIEIEMQDVDWNAMTDWQSQTSHILKDFKATPLGQNGMRMTLNATKKIRVQEKAMLTPNGKDFYRFYIDFVKCDKGCN